MAGASMKAIKTRIKSVESTMSITKAMELVAASKLRRAKQQEEAVKPFYQLLENTISDIMKGGTERHPYLAAAADIEKRSGGICYIVIAGDRGLAGGYNNNLFRLVKEQIQNGDCVIPVGKKSLDYYFKQPYEILTDAFSVTAEVGIPESHEIGAAVCNAYLSGKCSGAVVVYTAFRSMLMQEPMQTKLLPLDKTDFLSTEAEGKTTGYRQETVYEPSPEAVLDRVIPQYVSGMIYGAVCEAQASEFAARRTSMSAANKNAGEMIDTLTLRYNRARQAMITQEITEIVAGSES